MKTLWRGGVLALVPLLAACPPPPGGAPDAGQTRPASSSHGSSGPAVSSSQGTSGSASANNSAASSSGAACTPGSGAASASSSGIDPAVTAFLSAYWDAACDLDARCAPQVGGRYSSAAACKASAGLNVQALAQLAGLFSLGSAAQRSQCLADLPVAPCNGDPNRALNVCGAVFQPPLPVALGEACGGAKVCERALYCDGETAQTCGICRSLPTAGQPCAQGSCADGMCITETDGGSTCVGFHQLKTVGQACTRTTGECAGNLLCTQGSDGGVCSMQAGAGSACAGPFSAGCFADVPCRAADAGSQCSAPSAEGAPCQRDGPGICGVQCNFQTPAAPEGTCSNTLSLPQPGQPCAASHVYQIARAYVCSTEGFPQVMDDAGPGMACVCAPRAGLCGTCANHDQCAEGYCDFGAHMCRPRRVNGAACVQSQECESGNCTSGFCVASLQCP